MISEKNISALEETGIDWQNPIPLLHPYEKASPYPIQCLPNIIGDAVRTYHQFGKQPLSLIACSALASISLACQSLANVARDRLLVSPVSLYFLLVAISGERKSSIDHVFSHGIKEWEINIRGKLDPEIRIARTLHQAWFAEKEGILNQIRRSSLSGEDTTSLKDQFVEVVENEPIVPLLPELFFEDTTQEALASHLAGGWPSASLWSDEGGIVINGHGMQNNNTKLVALLNRLWDGKNFTAHRKTSKNFTIADRRFTVSLMLQPLILQQMLSKGGGVNRQSGFMARCLMAYPESSMGERYYEEPPESLSGLSTFHDRILASLDASLSLDKSGCHEIPNLHFSNQAKAAWVSFFNEIETGLSDEWSTIKDFASKAAENTARLSALFHLFTGQNGVINYENMEQAIGIIRWHLSETRRIFYAKPKSTKHADAIKLIDWIIEKSFTSTTPRYLQQYGPLRERQGRNQAIEMLIEHHYLSETNTDGKTVILVNPAVFEKY